MKRLAAVVLCGVTLFAQPPDPKLELLRLTDELDAAIRAGNWNQAAALSTKLKAEAEAARNQSMSKSGGELADQFLDWLPPNTETVVVVQQPFKVPDSNINRTPDPLVMAESYPLLLLAAPENQKLGKAFEGRTMRFAAIGARGFGKDETPHGLGMISFEGCAIYTFLEPIQESVFERKPDESVMGRPVWISKGSFSDAKETDTFLVALPKPDLILACNNRDFFSETVSRMSAPQKPRALPADLPEWKHVDRSAPLWGLRHVGEGFNPGLLVDPDRKELLISALTVEFGRAAVKTRALAKGTPWASTSGIHEFEGKAESREIADGFWELTVPDTPQAGGMAVFVLMAMLGFVVAL